MRALSVFRYALSWSLLRFLVAASASASASASAPALSRRFLRSLQQEQDAAPPVVRTDLLRLVPFQIQIAIRDETTGEEAELVSEILYEGGARTLLTDTITDWLVSSFASKSTGAAGELLGIGNATSFDSIALEMVGDSASTGTIDGQELSLVQVSFEGVSLWERTGTGTAPMEAENVELIQRATFLEDKRLRDDLQAAIASLLYDLGLETTESITILDVRAYITPPGSILDGSGGGSDAQPTDSAGTQAQAGDSGADQNNNLEIIIIVAIVVACLAFALLIFAVVWAWRADRNDRGSSKSSSASGGRKRTKKKNAYDSVRDDDAEAAAAAPAAGGKGGRRGGKKSTQQTAKQQQREREQPPPQTRGSRGIFSKKNRESPEPASSPSRGGMVIGDTTGGRGVSVDISDNETDDDDTAGNATNDSYPILQPNDSVVSSDISSSLTAYYKSGMGYGGGSGSKNSGRSGARDFNDAASMSSMDSYGYSLDGYAPSLGPAQGGYPVGPMQAAANAPIPIGTSQDEELANHDDFEAIRQLQEDESIVDYQAEA
ncbi:unnamed protein product [Pseudo-nitzschia multistriata]|uniref:SEA domain-containing protein n=1 Tax=Pseudo-nitzschia multistriata TaxID=183589 RepID=A0A448YZQ5_9STRA|nr:unnamed protein product [Pseudo-nitzschia multistriata]